MDKLLTTLNQFLTAAQTTITQYAPEVWKATLHLIQIQAWINIGTFAIFALSISVLNWGLKSCFIAADLPKDSDYSFDQTNALWVRRGIVLGLSFVVLMAFLSNAFDLFIRAFYPELSVLYTLASKAGLL